VEQTYLRQCYNWVTTSVQLGRIEMNRVLYVITLTTPLDPTENETNFQKCLKTLAPVELCLVELGLVKLDLVELGLVELDLVVTVITATSISGFADAILNLPLLVKS